MDKNQINKEAKKYATTIIKGHKPWEQVDQVKLEAFKAGANFNKSCISKEDIRKKLLELNPQINDDSEYTNPFLYRDIGTWYKELGESINYSKNDINKA